MSALLQKFTEETVLTDPKELPPLNGADYIAAWDDTYGCRYFPTDTTPKNITNYIATLFYPAEKDKRGMLTGPVELALSELQNSLKAEEYEQIGMLTAYSVSMAAAYKFESLDLYLSYGDYSVTYLRNIFHPARMIALGSYIANLTVEDYIKRAAYIDNYGLFGPLTNEKLAHICKGHYKPMFLKNSFLNFIDPDITRQVQNLPYLKPDWDLIYRFSSAKNVSGKSLNSNDLRRFTSQEYWDNMKAIEFIYPHLNAQLICSAIQRLDGVDSKYERI